MSVRAFELFCSLVSGDLVTSSGLFFNDEKGGSGEDRWCCPGRNDRRKEPALAKGQGHGVSDKIEESDSDRDAQ